MRLAIFTNKPIFDKPLCVGTPIVEKNVKESYFKYMDEVFERRWFTNNGPLVQRLEKEIARIHGVKHCVVVCNATIGEILVLKAMDLKGEVILPSFTFIATAHACLWQGVKPIFCDISQDNLTIDVDKAGGLITEKTSAIIGVHLFGNMCDITGLTELCSKNNIRLIFDAAHAFNCLYRGESIGVFGDAVILSFHATKFFGTFEGGAILTNNSELANRLRFLKNFGFRTYDDVGYLGINGKMTESQAAMGLASLQAINSRIERLKKIFTLYQKELGSIPGISLLPAGNDGETNYQYIVVFIDEKRFGLSRDVLYRVLWKENIIARRYFYPGCHRMEPYNSLYPDAYARLGITEDVSKRILCLPSGLESPEESISVIGDIIRTVHENADRVLNSANEMEYIG